MISVPSAGVFIRMARCLTRSERILQGFQHFLELRLDMGFCCCRSALIIRMPQRIYPKSFFLLLLDLYGLPRRLPLLCFGNDLPFTLPACLFVGDSGCGLAYLSVRVGYSLLICSDLLVSCYLRPLFTFDCIYIVFCVFISDVLCSTTLALFTFIFWCF